MKITVIGIGTKWYPMSRQTRWSGFVSHILLTENHSKGRVNIDNDRSIYSRYPEVVESTFEKQTEGLKYRHGYHLEMNSTYQ
jgi:hypothetical protein